MPAVISNGWWVGVPLGFDSVEPSVAVSFSSIVDHCLPSDALNSAINLLRSAVCSPAR
jgi:hypothetical protein